MDLKRSVEINGKKFVPYITEKQILDRVSVVADEINIVYKDATQATAPIFLSVLNGAFMYTSDLLKKINVPCEVQFIKLSSYEQMGSTGNVTQLIGLKHDVKGRDVILLDDIIDSGKTMETLISLVSEKSPKSIRVSALIYKPHACKANINVDFPCITMNDDNFIIGYGLDYVEMGRNLNEIFILE